MAPKRLGDPAEFASLVAHIIENGRVRVGVRVRGTYSYTHTHTHTHSRSLSHTTPKRAGMINGEVLRIDGSIRMTP